MTASARRIAPLRPTSHTPPRPAAANPRALATRRPAVPPRLPIPKHDRIASAPSEETDELELDIVVELTELPAAENESTRPGGTAHEPSWGVGRGGAIRGAMRGSPFKLPNGSGRGARPRSENW